MNVRFSFRPHRERKVTRATSARLESLSTLTGSDVDTPPLPPPPLSLMRREQPPPPPPPPPPPLSSSPLPSSSERLEYVDAPLQPPLMPPPSMLGPRNSTLSVDDEITLPTTSTASAPSTSAAAVAADVAGESPPADPLPPLLPADALNSELASNRMFRKLSGQITRFLDECITELAAGATETSVHMKIRRLGDLHYERGIHIPPTAWRDFKLAMMAMLAQCEYKSPTVS